MYKCTICKRISSPNDSCAQIYTPKKKYELCWDCYQKHGKDIHEKLKIEAREQWLDKFNKQYAEKINQILNDYSSTVIEGVKMSRIFNEYRERGKDYVFSKLDKSDMSEEQKAVAKVAIYANLALQKEIDYKKAIYEINNVMYVYRSRSRKTKSA